MKTRRARHRKSMESAFGVLPKWQTDIWAALLFLDRSKIAAAKQRLEQRPCNGIRYFSSFSCVAALQDAKAVDRELRRIERQAAWEELDVARRQALTPRSS